MMSALVIIAQAVGVLICFAIPILGFIILRKRFGRITRPFLVGMLCFFSSQILLRLPIISILLPSMLWFNMLTLHPIAYAVFLSLTAGIFEEIGRFFFIALMLKRNRRHRDAIAFGVGHAGIEAVILIGISALISFVYSILLRYEPSPGLTSNPAIISSLVDMTSTDGFMAGIERIAALGVHIGLTVMVFEGINRKKPFPFLIGAVAVHTAVNMLSLLLYTILGLHPLITQGLLLLAAALLIIYAARAKKRFEAFDVGRNGDNAETSYDKDIIDGFDDDIDSFDNTEV